MKVVGSGQKEFTQHYPASGWVEHDPEEIWSSVVATAKAALKNAGRDASDVAAIGITNQRETVVIWDRATGKPIHNAIVWQDRRTAPLCQKLKKQGLEKKFTRKTGLLLDPYFSGTKIAWMLDKVKGARKRAEKGELLAGTIDSFLIWRLTGGKVHATDATNASRTLVYNIEKNAWDDELLAILGIPAKMLPQVKDCADDYGVTDKSLFGAEIKILGVAGDQHAATIGQACFEPGMMKSTYGTGCFALLNTGSDLVRSKNRLLTTIAYRLNGKTTYALEGSIFIAGAAVQWLRDGIKVIGKAEQSGVLAAQCRPDPRSLSGAGFRRAWRAALGRRGARRHLRADPQFGPGRICPRRARIRGVPDARPARRHAQGLEGRVSEDRSRVDGGMVASDWTMQRLADILDAPVDRPTILETTALGAAWLAGSKAGVWPKTREFAKSWALERRFRAGHGSSVAFRKAGGLARCCAADAEHAVDLRTEESLRRCRRRLFNKLYSTLPGLINRAR